MRPPALEQVFDTADQTDELFLAVDPDYLRTFCARLLGKPLPSEIAFQANMPADSPQGRALKSACEVYLAADDGSDRDTATDERFQEFFATTLLMHHPHTFWEELTGRGSRSRSAPRCRRRR